MYSGSGMTIIQTIHTAIVNRVGMINLVVQNGAIMIWGIIGIWN